VDSQTLEEIKNGLETSKLEFLKSSQIDGDRRHASIRACLEYSFGLLPNDTKHLLSQVSVFAGGFFADDVKAVCGLADHTQLIALQERNFLVRRQISKRSRYSMLTTVHDFVAEKLEAAEFEHLQHTHAQYFLSALSHVAKLLRGSQYADALERIDVDLENFDAGARTTQKSGDYQSLLAYTSQLADYLSVRGRFVHRLTLAHATRDTAEALGPKPIADAEHNLGDAYVELPTGNRTHNVRIAIDHYHSALGVRTERNFPLDWSLTQTHLGLAYWLLPTGDRGDNVKRAIDHYQAALRVRTAQDFPYEWALTQINLGNAFANLPTGDRNENLNRAISCYQSTLPVWTKQDFPRGWATAQTNLGAIYCDLRTGDRNSNLRIAIASCEAALQVWTERDFPQDWAMAQHNLGFAYANLETDVANDNVKRAIEFYSSALRVRTESDFPRAWALTQHNLGTLYAKLQDGDRSENLKLAIECYQAALRVRTEYSLPQEWALTQEGLGSAYSNLPTNDRLGDLPPAIEHYENAARGFLSVGMTNDADRAHKMMAKAISALEANRSLEGKLHYLLQKLWLFRK
jgi:tetratricopeptide (TPR) repeat protein